MTKRVFLSDAIFSSTAERNLIDGAVIVDGEKIVDVVEGLPSQKILDSHLIHDYRGHLLCPGLIDAHTHLVHGGSRAHELKWKLEGKSYMEIHEAGGGIFSTVEASRKSDADELYAKALNQIRVMAEHGTTTVESKSGYCLDLEGELKLLEVNRRLQETTPMTIVVTYMGAHATPPDAQGGHEGYIEEMLNVIMPQVKEQGIAEFVDIFCEEGIFSLEETERLGRRALELGFGLKVHADEIVSLGGAGQAARLGAISAEHLMEIRDEDIPALKASGTVAVLLPATSFYLMSPRYAPAQKMLEQGVTVAIATDFNPGSCPCPNLQMAMWIAAFNYKMTPIEILESVTINAARAIGREATIGSLEAGKNCDLTIFNVKSPEELIYQFGRNLVRDVWKNGEQIVSQSRVQF